MSKLKLYYVSFRGFGAIHAMAEDFGGAVANGHRLGVPAMTEAVGGELSFDDPTSAFADVEPHIQRAAKDPKNHDRLMGADELERIFGDKMADPDDVDRLIKERATDWRSMQ